jgi:hypothetical protein
MERVLRGAANTVKNAANLIRNEPISERLSVADSDENSFLFENAKEKVNLTIKSSPSKDARVSAALSVKRGFALKRNEQGGWQKRFLCSVPHQFLYYYDIENSDSPRGVIDLHYFNRITIEGSDNNILKLSAEAAGLRYISSRLQSSHLFCYRSFYFQFDDPVLLNEWVASFLRDRYGTVRDERDAYQQLQEQFSWRINEAAHAAEESNTEKEELKRKLLEARDDSLKAIDLVSAALALLEVSDDK